MITGGQKPLTKQLFWNMKRIYVHLILLIAALPADATRVPMVINPQLSIAKIECKIQEDWKSKRPSGQPLVLQTELEVLRVRDVPDSGGTYGVDIK